MKSFKVKKKKRGLLKLPPAFRLFQVEFWNFFYMAFTHFTSILIEENNIHMFQEKKKNLHSDNSVKTLPVYHGISLGVNSVSAFPQVIYGKTTLLLSLSLPKKIARPYACHPCEIKIYFDKYF